LRCDDYNCDRQSIEILLVRQILIRGYHHLESIGGTREQLAVLQPRPSHLLNG